MPEAGFCNTFSMKTTLKNILITAFLIILVPAALFSQHNCEIPDDNSFFSLCIEQYGRPVTSANGRVTLDKAPFTLVLVTRGSIGILVNCSEKSDLYKGFLKNRPLAEITDQPDMYMGIGEVMFNPDEMFLIDKLAAHYLYYSGPDSHRYSSAEKRGEWIIGHRIISNYTTYDDGFLPVPIEELETDSLYLSLMYEEYDKDYNRVEIQKEGLKIIFR